MRRNKKYYFSLFICLWYAFPSFACLNPISLNDRVDKADHIALGKVIKSHSIWDANQENIYTIYTIQSEAYLKGKPSNLFFEIILLGGVVGDEAQIISPSATLRNNQSYLFTLENIPILKNSLFRSLTTSNFPQYQ